MKFEPILAATAAMFLGIAASAAPLITSSEETPARLCLRGGDAPERLVALCDMALGEVGLTAAGRGELLTARAGALFDMGRHVEAEAGYRAAIGADARSVTARNGLGWVLWDLGRHGAAQAEFQASVDVHVTGNGLSGLASAGYRAGGFALDEAIEMLDAAVSIDPSDHWSMREKGWLLRGEGRHGDAEAAFRGALMVSPRDANAQYGLGRVLFDQGRAEDALAAYGMAIALDNRELGPYLHRSYALRALDRNAQALEDAERVIALAPAYSGGYVEKALCLAALERRGRAIEVFEVAEAKGLADNYLLYWFADTLSDDGQNERALTVIDRALELDGRAAVDFALKASIANRLDRYDAALEAAQIAAMQDPDLAYADYHAAVALVGRGDAVAGIERFDLAMQKGLPSQMVGAFASQLVRQGKYVAAIALRGKY